MDFVKLRAELSRDEGRKLVAYRDSLGYWTIGVGHLLGTSPRMSTITDAECDALLDADINTAEGIARGLVSDPVGIFWNDRVYDARKRALTNMAFNLGSKLSQFVHFLQAVRDERWEDASKEMLQSLWAKQVGARAMRLSQMILTGEDLA